MGRAPGGQRISEWTFTETLSLDDIELRERTQVEDGELHRVPYAAVIQGRETSLIAYVELRKICGYLGVRYYKNRTKDTMLEIIAQHKLCGQTPESYRKKPEKKPQVLLRQPMGEDEDRENQDPATESVESPEILGVKRRRESMEETSPTSGTFTITTSSNAHTFLQPIITSHISEERRSPATEYDSGIPTTPIEEPSRTVEMSLTDRVDTFNLLRHIRQQIQHVEEEIVRHTPSDMTQTSALKTQRLGEDLQFYLAERKSLIQQLENSR
ncbi:hypothetical protein PHMEG_00016412 [Phytophthora megakarya]|uniref:Uncharacterized protein n=1 Tax=Phytophthora megakarya TaxID=4795 RepID=A0A225W0K3_9STRA|nr:hypothetical protein PHMEG_00016412 [Phytophthora megakarya]